MKSILNIALLVSISLQADPLDPNDDLDCSQDNILIAGQVDPVGYPGG